MYSVLTVLAAAIRTQRIIDIADGNPRLLKWLLEVIQQPGLAADELLNRLEATEQKFRENILAQTLLDALEPEEQKFLARLSVFHLPVMEEIVRAISTAGELAVLGKLTSLSLVESATTHPNQSANYRVTTILESLLEPVLSEEEWQATRQQGVRKIHQVWCEENENPTEAERLEIVRLGLLAKEEEIAVSVGDQIADHWVNNSRFVEALDLCEQVLAVFPDYRILGTVARAEEVLGFVQKAVIHFQQALDLCPEEELTRKAVTLTNMALVIAQQGDIKKAIALWEQSLEISEQIGDVKGKAATLSNMAGVIAQQGDIPKAIALWEQSLEISEQIGNVQYKATTLISMALLIAQQGDIKKAIALWEQVASTLAQISAYGDLVTVLSNLGLTVENNGLVYLAQAIWLMLRIQAPLAQTIQLIRALYNRVPQGDELEALLGAMAMFFCNRRGEGHPQLEELQEHSFKMISGTASAQGIETQKAFEAWYVQQRLNDPEYFLPRLNQRLEEIVGDGWLFDPSQISMGE